MITTKKTPKKVILDLDSPDGNAFVIAATARNLCKQLEYSEVETEKLLTNMLSKDYEHVVATFEMEFGSIVQIEGHKSMVKAVVERIKILSEAEKQRESVTRWLET